MCENCCNDYCRYIQEHNNFHLFIYPFCSHQPNNNSSLAKASPPSLFHKSTNVSNLLSNIDTSECNLASLNGVTIEENQALEGDSLIDNALQSFNAFSETAQALRDVISQVLELKKNGTKKNAAQEGDKKSKINNSLKTKGIYY